MTTLQTTRVFPQGPEPVLRTRADRSPLPRRSPLAYLIWPGEPHTGLALPANGSADVPQPRRHPATKVSSGCFGWREIDVDREGLVSLSLSLRSNDQALVHSSISLSSSSGVLSESIVLELNYRFLTGLWRTGWGWQIRGRVSEGCALPKPLPSESGDASLTESPQHLPPSAWR